MHINTTQEMATYTRKVKNKDKTIEYKRKRTIYHLKCDSCGIEFTRYKGRMSESRLKFKHICSDCGPSASSKLSIESQRNNILKTTPIGTIKNTWGKYPVIFIGFDNDLDLLYTKNAGSNGWVRHHTYVMETHLQRKMNKGEIIHHVDGDKTNNDLTNLKILTVQEHNNCHAKSESLVFEMVKRGFVIFNEDTKLYEFSDIIDNLKG